MNDSGPETSMFKVSCANEASLHVSPPQNTSGEKSCSCIGEQAGPSMRFMRFMGFMGFMQHQNGYALYNGHMGMVCRRGCVMLKMGIRESKSKCRLSLSLSPRRQVCLPVLGGINWPA